jgi:hypothetical protein
MFHSFVTYCIFLSHVLVGSNGDRWMACTWEDANMWMHNWWQTNMLGVLKHKIETT